jgi:hypothetical protein
LQNNILGSENESTAVSFETLMAMIVKIMVFLVLTQCRFVGGF